MKILIVEDEAIDRLILRSAVVHLGHECLVAASGADGWEMFGIHHPDVVISDWQMPGMDGVELCERIRAVEWPAYTPFIFVTGLTDKEHALAGIENGADDYLTKPLDVHELRVRLITVARVKRAEMRYRQQRDAMAESEKLRALGQLAGGIAHDLNQSLMIVVSYTNLAQQILVQAPPDMAELDNLLATIAQAALDGGQSVKRLLQFTRSAPPEYTSERVDLSTLVREAVQLTAAYWQDGVGVQRPPITVEVDAQSHPIVLGSPGRLRDLITNLIFNAADALPAGGAIQVRTAVDDGKAIIEVTDSGVGMSVEVQQHVFEPFFTTKGHSGSGMGLALALRIVEQHAGHIEVRSTPGEGTTFRATFPLVEASADLDPCVATGRSLEPPPSLRVLAVDDEPMMTRAVVRMLKPTGYSVSVAGSGEEALEKLAAQTFDVVLSDMGMGSGMNGWDLADAVQRRWPGVRFLLATGYGATIEPGEARNRGVEAVLSKPYLPADLLRALRNHAEVVDGR